MTKAYFKYKMRKLFLPHYLIIGKYINEPIGCTCGKKGKEEVLEEEPGATFRRISKKKCPICNKIFDNSELLQEVVE